MISHLQPVQDKTFTFCLLLPNSALFVTLPIDCFGPTPPIAPDYVSSCSSLAFHFFFYLVAASLERPYLRRVRERVVHE